VWRVVAVSSAFRFQMPWFLLLWGGGFFHDTVKDVAEMERNDRCQRLELDDRPASWSDDGSRTEHYRYQRQPSSGFGFKVSRADVAHFMLGEAQANRHLRKVVGVCY